MTAARSYLFAVQDGAGREVCSTRRDVAKVGDVTAAKVDETVVQLRHGDEVIAAGETGAAAGELALLRWPAKAKLAKPVRKRVDTPDNRQ